jgi:hypothetical protein
MAVLGQWKWLLVNDFEFFMEDLTTATVGVCFFICHMLHNCAVIRCVKLKKKVRPTDSLECKNVILLLSNPQHGSDWHVIGCGYCVVK